MSLKRNFETRFPDRFFLDGQNLSELTNYLRRNNRLGSDEEILRTEKPGEGNMNYVLRVESDQRSFILKQARPWVEKYPQIPAPIERSRVEADFLKQISKHANLTSFCPQLLFSDEENFLIAFEDLGSATDFSFLYKPGTSFEQTEIDSAISFLRTLHELPLEAFPENMEMRKLNHEHIFNFPFQEENGLDLDGIQKGLSLVAQPYVQHVSLKTKIQQAGAIYLSKGHALLHGDYYPGSWLRTSSGIKIIDPEFAFHGPPEFDLGVMIAHMFLSGQEKKVLQRVWKNYQAPANFDTSLLSAFTGIEIMRRLIGIAQLPLTLSISDKINLMSKAAQWIEKENLLKELS